ncbi:MAG TPA: alpha/beta hydrolase [Solirubrobacteraceae bacterium]|jgi:pimeloyl-ACP methyl ester carboxylesterase|nr:alpha/beta hydrolase [Solirubrobacteraceae bacterium]
MAVAETFVLLHGSWHGGWAWEPTAWCLRELGHEVHAPTYPGHQPGAPRAGIRHRNYVRSVVDFIEGRDLRDVVLVGHSFGGSVVSRVSEEIPERLARLVFHTAFVVEDGASVNDNLPQDQTDAFAAAAAASPDNTVACPWEVFRDRFIQDASPEAARAVWERLVPQPFSPWEEKLDLAVFHRGELPRSFIAVADDLALPPGTWHPHMSSRLGDFKLVEMGGSHEVMFTRPAQLARALVEAAGD